MRARGLAAALIALGIGLVVGAPAGAAPGIHAHRGGSVLGGEPTFGENTLPAFRNAIREGYVLELDVKLTRDRIPVVFHDPGLARVTPCEGPVAERGLDELGACPVDVLGSPGGELASRPAPEPERIPTLIEVLALARDEGGVVNLEIKNQPGDWDFDAGESFAGSVMDTVLASGLPKERLIVQSFAPANLDVAKRRLPGVETSLLTLGPLNSGAPTVASSGGYEWVSPQWPVSTEYVRDAKALGRKVVPFTLNNVPDIQGAGAVQATALITDDPLLAQRALGLKRTDLVPDLLPPTAVLLAPRYASDTARGPLFRFPVAGDDRGSGIAGIRVEQRLNAGASARWRPLGPEGPPRGVRFRGAPGETYRFRARARDRVGNLSGFAYGLTTVPLDDRSSRLTYDGRWRRLRVRRAYGRTLSRPRAAGATVELKFRGNRVAVVTQRPPRLAQLLIRVDGHTRFVSSFPGRRRRVYRSPRLRPGLHRLRITALSGPVSLDAVAVEQGPRPPG